MADPKNKTNKTGSVPIISSILNTGWASAARFSREVKELEEQIAGRLAIHEERLAEMQRQIDEMIRIRDRLNNDLARCKEQMKEAGCP